MVLYDILFIAKYYNTIHQINRICKVIRIILLSPLMHGFVLALFNLEFTLYTKVVHLI